MVYIGRTEEGGGMKTRRIDGSGLWVGMEDVGGGVWLNIGYIGYYKARGRIVSVEMFDRMGFYEPSVDLVALVRSVVA